MAMDIDQGKTELHHLLQAGDDKGLKEYLANIQPADMAEILQQLTVTRRWQVLEAMEVDVAARTIENVEYEVQHEILTSLPKPLATCILSHMSEDDLADMLGEVSLHQAEEILALIPQDAQVLRKLMQYPENTAGGLMTTEVVAVKQDDSISEATEKLRKMGPKAETIYYLYATNEKNQLVGVISLRQLVFSPPHLKVQDIATTNVISVPADTHQEQVAKLFGKYDLLALPVVDHDSKLLGIVTVDDVIDVIVEETTEDISRMGGQEPLDEPYLSASVLRLVSKRIWWLLILFVAQSITVNLLSFFENALQAVIALTFFIPLLIGTAGNAGSQAATLVVRAMALGEVAVKDFLAIIVRESKVGVILGSILAAITFVWTQLLGGSPAIGYTVGLSIFVIVIVASVIGAFLPLLAKKLRFDPAVASAPLITTLTDSSGLLIYFTIAKLIFKL
jgi:magnesium transporter